MRIGGHSVCVLELKWLGRLPWNALMLDDSDPSFPRFDSARQSDSERANFIATIYITELSTRSMFGSGYFFNRFNFIERAWAWWYFMKSEHSESEG